MSTSTIPLSKGFNAKRLRFPCSVSVKLDGVPIVSEIVPEYGHKPETRQGTKNVSASDLSEHVYQHLTQLSYGNSIKPVGPNIKSISILGELTHPDYPAFKDVSGVVRRREVNTGLIWNLFDYVDNRVPDMSWHLRQLRLVQLVSALNHPRIKLVEQVRCRSVEDVTHALARIEPDEEGGVIRWHGDLWEPNKRGWGYMKHVVRPTVDLIVVGFEEAVSKDGAPLGRVGRLKCRYKDSIIGVGAGKMTHVYAKELWEKWTRHCNTLGMSVHSEEGHFLFENTSVIAEVQYKRDLSYTALREPTFQHWRPEKTEPSYE